jgi:hypothetical protein
MDWPEAIKDWFLSLGEKYNVNPIIFGSIYVGAIPFFFASLTWLIKRLRKGKPIVLQVLLTSFFFVSAYLYLIIAGKNIPAWVYVFIGIVLIYGISSTLKKIRDRIKSINQ